MPSVHASLLTRICHDILLTVGASEEEASTVARHQIGANLAGHDSHGIILLSTYVDRIRKGHIVPGARFEVVHETPTTARISGNWGFGQVVQTRATRLAIEKARNSMVAAVTVAYQSHVGRLADYPLMAAEAGMIGMLVCDSGRGPKYVAPFGGRDARLGTNPISMALPSNLEAPIFVDMATSQVAGGKILVYRNRRKPVPLGWLLDKNGNPTTDPNDYFAGGALLPLGGLDAGHKGYGLSTMVDVFAGILTGLGWGIDPAGKHNDGSLFIAINVEAFRPLEEFRAEVSEFARFLKASPPAQGFKEVLYPGEIEWLTTQERLRTGIPVEDDTWTEIQELAASAGVSTE
ncbi:MAG TPA: Ldh family oxidoreductase [Candidatus Methylomirabilis sp.]|nr:Ldh family oxidoreductase [Candidatus Methylomirabilis sp.]